MLEGHTSRAGERSYNLRLASFSADFKKQSSARVDKTEEVAKIRRLFLELQAVLEREEYLEAARIRNEIRTLVGELPSATQIDNWSS